MSTQAIEQLEAELAQAMLNNDLKTLDRLLSDDLIFTGPDGNTIDKAQDLALHRSGDTLLTTYEMERLLIRIYGSIAITDVKVRLAGSFKSESFEGLYQYLRIYLNQHDRWQIIGGQVTAITA
jgi:ketosteroid isomerase-like protein